MWKRIVASAPGKVILFGEHAVLYGKKALVLGIGLRTDVTIESTKEHNIKFFSLNDEQYSRKIDEMLTTHGTGEFWHWTCSDMEDFLSKLDLPQTDEVTEEQAEELAGTIKKFLLVNPSPVSDGQTETLVCFLFLLAVTYRANPLPGMTLIVESNLPRGAGLGSSAAFSVSLATALLAASGLITEEGTSDDQKVINKYAYLAEKVFHGKPSGADNTVATYGGAIWFQNGQSRAEERIPELRLVVVDTKVPRQTKLMVQNVKDFVTKFPAIGNSLIDSIGHVADSFEDLLGKGKEDIHVPVNRLIEVNHHLLCALGVGHSEIDRAVALLGSEKMAAKITGAGGGGNVVAVVPKGVPNQKLNAFLKLCEEQGFAARLTEAGGDVYGVTLTVER